MVSSTRVALLTFVIGFLVEGSTELYQFVSNGYLGRGWVGLYYVGLGTTGLGFYLMYRGRHEWNDRHHRSVVRGHRLLYTGLALFLGAMAAIIILAEAQGRGGASSTPVLLVGLVGGLVALAFANFFLSLVALIHHLAGRCGRLLAWGAFAWSLGVAGLTGYLVGEQFPSLLRQFFTNPLELVVSFAPLAFAMSPLFVSYFLFAAAYADAARHLRLVFLCDGRKGPQDRSAEETAAQSPSPPTPKRSIS